jgi:hypothetical protein
MSPETKVRSQKSPGDIARKLAQRSRSAPRAVQSAWRRETFRLPRPEARAKAREWFDLYPKAAYMTEIEFWRVCDNDDIEFTIRRLPSAD